MPETLLNFWCWCVNLNLKDRTVCGWSWALCLLVLLCGWHQDRALTMAFCFSFVLAVPHCPCHRGQCPPAPALRWPLGEDHGVDVWGGALRPLHRLHRVPHHFLEKESLKVAGENAALSPGASPSCFLVKTHFTGGWSGTFYWIVIKTASIFFWGEIVSQAYLQMDLNVCCFVTKKMCFPRPLIA